MDRLLLVASTFFFLFGFAQTMYALGARAYRHSYSNLIANLLGFLLQTGFLYLRGQVLGRCPLTNLFEVLAFLCWSMALFYLLIGPAYRLSLLGAFTSPLVFIIQIVALLLPSAGIVPTHAPERVNPWLELHAALTVVSCGAFALACVAGVMYLTQERQLKTRHLNTLFYHLPPIHDLATANSRLILAGFGFYTVGLIAGFETGIAHLDILRYVSVGIWVLYGAILVSVFWHRISPHRVAVLSVSAFCILLLTLWSIQSLPASAS
jgi:ABC-type transport system involved in cytochrome c biogenesis permease subunit